MGAGLNGGAFFELPGCVTTYAVGGRPRTVPTDPTTHSVHRAHRCHCCTGRVRAAGRRDVRAEGGGAARRGGRPRPALCDGGRPRRRQRAHRGRAAQRPHRRPGLLRRLLVGHGARWVGAREHHLPQGRGHAHEARRCVACASRTRAPPPPSPTAAAQSRAWLDIPSTAQRPCRVPAIDAGINVHGDVRNWTGEDLHFENQGDDVYAVWGAGGGAQVDGTGLGKPYAKCGLSNTPASDITFRRVFAGAGASEWSSCAHVFGVGRVVYDQMLCCSTPSNHPALIVDSSFCPDYKAANVTVRGLRWFRGADDLCAAEDGASPVSAGTLSEGSATGWKRSDLDLRGLGCGGA